MYLLDTNILSELIKKRPNQHLMERLTEVPGTSLYTSCICAMELRFGSALRNDCEVFWQRITTEILSRVTIIPLGYDQVIIAGDVLARLKKAGSPIGIEDVLIAATALSQKLIIVTGNEQHFARVEGLVAQNWLNP